MEAQLFAYVFVSQHSETTAALPFPTSRVFFSHARREVLVPIYQHHQPEQHCVNKFVALHIGSERVRQAVQQALL